MHSSSLKYALDRRVQYPLVHALRREDDGRLGTKLYTRRVRVYTRNGRGRGVRATVGKRRVRYVRARARENRDENASRREWVSRPRRAESCGVGRVIAV